MRECSECKEVMHEGYCIDSGLRYYCSVQCLHKHYTQEEWLALYDDGDGDSYWTEWEEDICDSCHAEFDHGELKKVESQGEYFCPLCYDEWEEAYD